MGLDEFGREVRGMPSVTSSYGESFTSGGGGFPKDSLFRYEDDPEDSDDRYRKEEFLFRDKRKSYRGFGGSGGGDGGVSEDTRRDLKFTRASSASPYHSYYYDSTSTVRTSTLLPRSRSNSMDRDDRSSWRMKRGRSGISSGTKVGTAGVGAGTAGVGRPSQTRGGPLSKAYVQQPLLCQFVWEKERQMSLMDPSSKEQTSPQQHATNLNNLAITASSAEIQRDESIPRNVVDTMVHSDPQNQKSLLDQEYCNYNRNYCLKYIRHFFNRHIDDMWFRQRYSPLEYKRFVEQERNRASLEAAEFLKEVLASVQDYHTHSTPHHHNYDDDDDAKHNLLTNDHRKANHDDSQSSSSTLSAAVPSFVLHARLGGGIKPTTSSSSSSNYHDYLTTIPSNRKRKYSSSMMDGMAGAPHHDPVKESGIPKSHLFSFLQQDNALYIMGVPCDISDMHLYNALRHHSENDSIQILSSLAVGGVASAAEDTGLALKELYKDEAPSKKKSGHYLDRCAWAIFNNRKDKEMVLENLFKAQRHPSDRSRNFHRDDDRETRQMHPHTSRLPKVLELDVDCSDPFGRTEIDADGKGGAAHTTKEGNAGDHVPSGLPIRRVSVFVSTYSAIHTQSVTVLSAALSRKCRYKDDRRSAELIAKRLDILRNIPVQCRLVNILSKLFKNKEAIHPEARFQHDSDVLDVSIAYLRRVHLFSFYNGCVAADNVGATLSGKHPTSVVHLRLKDADEILNKTKEENSEIQTDALTEDKVDESELKDMLAMRLDASITRALDILSIAEDMEMASPFVVNETIDPLASEIESMEEKSKNRWLIDHSIIDEDERARCSFHFCRKLFKDTSYLTKHLVKKHVEHLKAEMAKCHDQYMMAWWEEETMRPIPPVLVECGPKFGLVECTFQIGKDPFVADPEPELWRKEKENHRRENDEMEERMTEKRKKRSQDENDQNDIESKTMFESKVYSGGFVDVDDMKDEKVELKFENIQPVKKANKKKKKNLLG